MRCPYCGGETDANRPFCRHCGKRIDSIQVEPVPTGQTGGERSPYGQGRGNSPAPYPSRGRESRSRGDILMIVIGVILALAAVGIAVFILTHMIGDGTVGRRDDAGDHRIGLHGGFGTDHQGCQPPARRRIPVVETQRRSREDRQNRRRLRQRRRSRHCPHRIPAEACRERSLLFSRS